MSADRGHGSVTGAACGNPVREGGAGLESTTADTIQSNSAPTGSPAVRKSGQSGAKPGAHDTTFADAMQSDSAPTGGPAGSAARVSSYRVGQADRATAAEELVRALRACGLDRVQLISTGEIAFDESLRDLCRANACGFYGKSYTCPPHVGSVGALASRVRRFRQAAVMQKVYVLADSFDYEGMQRGLRDFCRVLDQVAETARELLDAGGAAVGSSSTQAAVRLQRGACASRSSCTGKTVAPAAQTAFERPCHASYAASESSASQTRRAPSAALPCMQKGDAAELVAAQTAAQPDLSRPDMGQDFWLLGAGACERCGTCGALTGEPCRNPERARISLEACGVHVSALAEAAHMPYLNGANTVTYFAALLFDVRADEA